MLFFSGTVSAAAATLRAGVAKADITPPPGILMGGYAARHAASTGTLDPLEVRALVLDDGHSRIVLVALDLGRSLGPPAVALHFSPGIWV